MILYYDCSSHLDSSKNMAARGRGLFFLYIYIENFKNLLVRNHWTDFNLILQKCSLGDHLPRLFKPFGFVKKHGRQGWVGVGGGAYFPYISIYKNLPVRNHWTNFNITWQECCFGNPLPKLFKSLMRRPTGDQEVAGSTPAEVGNILSWRLIMN